MEIFVRGHRPGRSEPDITAIRHSQKCFHVAWSPLAYIGSYYVCQAMESMHTHIGIRMSITLVRIVPHFCPSPFALALISLRIR